MDFNVGDEIIRSSSYGIDRHRLAILGVHDAPAAVV
jgi:hypothetical protein